MDTLTIHLTSILTMSQKCQCFITTEVFHTILPTHTNSILLPHVEFFVFERKVEVILWYQRPSHIQHEQIAERYSRITERTVRRDWQLLSWYHRITSTFLSKTKNSTWGKRIEFVWVGKMVWNTSVVIKHWHFWLIVNMDVKWMVSVSIG